MGSFSMLARDLLPPPAARGEQIQPRSAPVPLEVIAPAGAPAEAPSSTASTRPRAAGAPKEPAGLASWLCTAFARGSLAVAAVLAGVTTGGCASFVPPPTAITTTVDGARVYDPTAVGPHAVQRTEIQIPGVGGRTVAADLYTPHGEGPFPPIVHLYGLFSGRDKHAGTATHYASHGFIVIVPRMIHGSSATSRNSEEVEAFVDWIRSRPASLGPALTVERGVGLSGHSFGALTAVLAGDKGGVGAIVGLDPADQGTKGRDAAPGVRAPAVFVVGEKELFNQFGNSERIFEKLGGKKDLLRVRGASHGDFENAKESGPKNVKNAIAMRFATGFFLSELGGKSEYATYRGDGGEAAAARARGELEARK